jgi:hypothetical protein
VQVQREFRVQLKFLDSHLDVPKLTSLDDGSGVNWLDDCTNGVIQVLDQNWVFVFYANSIGSIVMFLIIFGLERKSCLTN